MNINNKVIIGLAVAILFQFTILTGIYVSAAIPLWIGTEIKVKTVPVDPRSMFRGNYARLSYDFSRVETSEFSGSEVMRNGEVVYIVLAPSSDGLYEFSAAAIEKPTSGIFLRGRVENNRWSRDGVRHFRINYGIEAFFAPKEKALEMERKLRNGGVAVLMVSSGGKARIHSIINE